jgi:predicted DNA-binding antitoxin AbrB/MazE fold protein
MLRVRGKNEGMPSIVPSRPRNRSTAGNVSATIRKGGQAMHEPIEVVYENGVLRPLKPLPPHLREHQHLTVTIDTPGVLEDRLDAACLAAAKRNADPTVSLGEARRILAKVPGTLAQAVSAEREER